MRLVRVGRIPPLVVLGVAVTLATTTTAQARLTAPRCPRQVDYEGSAQAPVAAALRAAQRILARGTINSQGRVYRLTPRHAPIDLIARIAIVGGSPLDRTVPGLLAIHDVAAKACGSRVAQVSWAVHYELPVSIIAGSAGYPFLVKIRGGWRFWGYWCGAGRSVAWRRRNCI